MKNIQSIFIVTIFALIASQSYSSHAPHASGLSVSSAYVAAGSSSTPAPLVIRISDEAEREREHILDEIKKITRRRSFIQYYIDPGHYPALEQLFLRLRHSPTANMIHLLIFLDAAQTLKIVLERLSNTERDNILSSPIDTAWVCSANDWRCDREISRTQITALVYAATRLNYDVIATILESHTNSQDIQTALRHLIWQWPTYANLIDKLRVIDLLISHAPQLVEGDTLHNCCNDLQTWRITIQQWHRILVARLNQIRKELPNLLKQRYLKTLATIGSNASRGAGLPPDLVAMIAHYDDVAPVQLPLYSHEIIELLLQAVSLTYRSEAYSSSSTHTTSCTASSRARRFMSATGLFVQSIFARARPSGARARPAMISSDVTAGSAATAH